MWTAQRIVRPYASVGQSKLYRNINYIRVRSFILSGAPNCHHSEQNREPGALDRPIVIGPFFAQLSGEAKLRQADIG